MSIRRPFLFAALATVAFVGLRGLWVGNLLPLKAGVAAPERQGPSYRSPARRRGFCFRSMPATRLIQRFSISAT